ncbi:hypothetical protein [Mesorhizobium sp. M1342]|uniref:hypothetical protein n=1 Tax=Mesorhizobium sp. M1342 TaxID=2957088 RepID=UPI00333A0698
MAELSRFGDEDERYSRLDFSADISALHLGHLPEGFGTGSTADLSITCAPRGD